jgi:Protein of unknown function (DUF3592)
MPWPAKIMFLFLCFCAIFCFFIGWRAFVDGRRSRRWPAAKATILHSRIQHDVSRDGEGRRHEDVELDIAYAYEVGGERYVSHAYRLTHNQVFGDGSEEMRKYPAGGEVTVHYDPSNPRVAVIDRRVPLGFVILMFIGGAFGVAMLVAGWPRVFGPAQ